jgi:hypothetical protein
MNMLGQKANHFSPYHLLPVKTSPLLACEESFTTGYEFSPCSLQLQSTLDQSGHISVEPTVYCSFLKY